jgi:phage FluMu protein Com
VAVRPGREGEKVITRYYSVTCDRCYTTQEIRETPTSARNAASTSGWRTGVRIRTSAATGLAHTEDYCPKCKDSERS